MPRLLGKGKSPGAAKPSLYARSRGGDRKSKSRNNDLDRSPAADPNEERLEAAAIQSVAAKIVLIRRKIERMRDATVVRDRSQAEVTTAAAAAIAELTGAALEKGIIEALAADLGDIEAEALRVTR